MAFARRAVTAALLLITALPASAQLTMSTPFVLTPPSILTLAGNGSAATTNGTGAAASFRSLQSITADPAGTIYVADFYDHVIRKVTAGGTATVIAGQPGQQGMVSGPPSVSKLGAPRAITFHNNEIYFVSAGNIGKIDTAGHLSMLAAPSGIPSQLDANSIVFKSNGELIINDRTSHGIWKRSSAGHWSIYAGSIGGVWGLDNSPGPAARFRDPRSMVIDPADNIYVVDTGNSVIRKIAPDTSVSTYAGSIAGHLDGPAASARFGKMNGIARAANGDLYVSDSHGGMNYIRKITAAGMVSTIYTNSSGFMDGPMATAKTGMITSIALVGTRLYLADDNDYTANNLSNRRLRLATLVSTRALRTQSRNLN